MSKARLGAGFGCFIGGVLSAAAGVGLETQAEPWLSGGTYFDDVNRAIGPLTHLLWGWAAQIGVVLLILALVLFAASYWLLGERRRGA